MIRAGQLLDIWSNDVRYAARGLRRSAELTVGTLVSLAVGIGANVATFTLLDRVFFQSPPGVEEAAAVRRLYIEARESGGSYLTEFSFPALMELTAAAQRHARVEGFEARTDRVLDDGSRTKVAYVTTGYFEMLGVRPSLGRFFAPEENRPGDPRHLVVLSDAVWRRVFGEDRSALGRTFRIDSVIHVVVGIVEREFEGVDMDPVGVWVPLTARPAFNEPLPLYDRSTHSIQLLARLEPSTDERMLAQLFSNVYARHNATDMWFTSFGRIITAPLREARGPFIRGSHNQRNLELAKRIAAVGLAVLLVAVVNVSSMQLLRTVRRRHELAVRMALGASRARLGVQLVTEAGLLALLAAVLALLLGWWGGTALRAMLVFNPSWSTTPFPARVVLVTAGLASGGGIIASMLPLLMARRANPGDALRVGGGQEHRFGPLLRRYLLATQTALCLALLACGGAFLQSLRRAGNVDPGFDEAKLVTIDASGRRLPSGFASEAAVHLRAVASVVSVANSASDLRAGSPMYIRVTDMPMPMDTVPVGAFLVDSAYFTTVGLRVVTGRGLGPADMMGTEQVAVISESLARRYGAAHNPLGRCLYLSADLATCRRIVGVVRDIRWNVTSQPYGEIYLPMAQEGSDGHHFVVRTDGPASAAIVAEVQRIMTAMLRDYQRPPRVARVADRRAVVTRPWTATAALLSLYGILALVSTAFGIYGSVSHEAVQRTRELGVRIAMGATTRGIVRVVFASTARAVALGLLCGVALILLLSRFFVAFLFDTSAYDPVAFVSAFVAIVTVTVAASVIPARRVAAMNPALALRSE